METAKTPAKAKGRVWPPSLRLKFTLEILALGLVLTCAMVSVTFVTYRDANLRKYQRIVSASAQMAASLVSAEDAQRYLAERVEDEGYLEQKQQLQNLLVYNDLTYVYVYALDFAGRNSTYIFDLAQPGELTAEEEALGYELPLSDESEDTSIALVRAVVDSKKPNLELNLSRSDSGYLASAFLPLVNEAGEVVAVAGADVRVDQVYSELRDIVLTLSAIMIGIIALSIFLFQGYVTRTMIRPLQLLVDSAQNFVSNRYGEGGENYEPPQIHTRDELERLADAFNQMTEDIAQYIRDVTQLTNERERVAAELAIATKIQESALPREFDIAPKPGLFELFATMDPAKEVGGDFYDFFLLDERRLCFLIGDVSGKGVPAALFMMMAKSVIRDQLLRGASLADAFAEANAQLCASNEEGMFVTVLCQILDLDTGDMQVADAGHGCPGLLRADGEIEWFKTKRGFVMGGMEGMRYRVMQAQLNPGDAVFLYTDGVSEADNAAKELFGAQRIDASLKAHWRGDVHTLLAEMRSDLSAFADGAPQADDITMLALYFRPDEAKRA